MQLTLLLQGLTFKESRNSIDIEINSVCFDSRKCTPGSLFIAVNGTQSDGHKFIDKAIENGAVAIVYQDGEFDFEHIASIKVENSRKALSQIAANYYDHPSSKLNLVGITGTNGKTTTVTLLYNLFTSLGYCCGLISTIANYIGTEKCATDHTTPDPLEINELMDRMVKKGAEYCFMEVSSHSLDQDRVFGLHFKGGIFSNLTHDHLDYHKTFAEYLRCKKSFFDQLSENAFALTNIDDKNGDVMVQNTVASIYRYSCRTLADFNCKIIEESLDGMLLKLDGVQVWSRFIGNHNAYNLLAVYACARLLGADKDEVLVKMSSLHSVAGRLEYLRGGKDVTAVVDYSHTPDALENALKTLRETGKDNELICVFGCGGNRDKTKRPEMGVIAAKYADKVIVTSDNPRFENPDEIIKDIKDGMDIKARSKSLFITDRREAIRAAIMMAHQGAIILVAGKGHEDYQIIGDVKHHFDDKEVIQQTFDEL
ncbi:MAG: UDP-N-acetylmuramoyl-L-alanyl-D-glutamate--2,6-diaminopimelate ligase [Bacteroidales bacterium]|nr:UDP-N-acetylmuramoyl-L-alanyl-D-glutamate--2,6-diaminopimelate ligase [Bacteroidales bacterium]MDD4669878.1 UDP-N-acetylmuramoyl-L-alanyl-D-glutamate--2,6-diaminopimelate ligase [Bacteroidales bacterium]